jgi:tRNA nucleotidyltransferase/poly(A) polymerase
MIKLNIIKSLNLNINKMNNTIKKILREGLIYESRIKTDMYVPEDILKIANVFKQNGFKLYIVGGAVRDFLLNKKIKDYDLATDAVPDKVEEMMAKAGFKTLPTGKAFGVINVFTDQGEYEVATFRNDVGSDGRRPDSVTFTDIEGDVKRRDLTINALFYDIESGEVVDLVGGINDLKNGIVRTVGAPEDRFSEDRLRILRAIRFAGRFGSDLDPAVDAALQKDASLEGISGERIRDEFIKGLASAKSAKHFLGMVDKYNLFSWVFKGLNVNKRFIDNDDPIILISMLLSKNELTTLAKKLNELKYSSDEVKKITTLIAMLNLDIDTAPKLKSLFVKSGLSSDQLRNFGSNMGLNSQLLDSFEEYLKLPNVTGPEAMEKYKIEKPGPELGKAINAMEIENFKKVL